MRSLVSSAGPPCSSWRAWAVNACRYPSSHQDFAWLSWGRSDRISLEDLDLLMMAALMSFEYSLQSYSWFQAILEGIDLLNNHLGWPTGGLVVINSPFEMLHLHIGLPSKSWTWAMQGGCAPSWSLQMEGHVTPINGLGVHLYGRIIGWFAQKVGWINGLPSWALLHWKMPILMGIISHSSMFRPKKRRRVTRPSIYTPED